MIFMNLRRNAGMTSSAACRTCVNRPTGAVYLSSGGESPVCPWACGAGYNISINASSCIACPTRPTNAHWAIAAAPNPAAAAPAMAPCSWECDGGFKTEGGKSCVACSATLQLGSNASWIPVLFRYRLSPSFPPSVYLKVVPLFAKVTLR